MTRKRTTRKVWALVNPIDYALAGCSITPRKDLDTLHVRELASLDDFTHGRASLQQWFDLCNVVNLCETLGKEGIGPEALPYCKTAEVELIAAARRFQSTQRMGLSGPGITAMREVIDYHDAQRSSISRSEYEKMIRLTKARVQSGKDTVDIGKLLEVA